MEKVSRKHPEDPEAAIFYALALLGTAPPADKTYANQKKAAAILNRILPDQPEHPGIAHYIIHSASCPRCAEELPAGQESRGARKRFQFAVSVRQAAGRSFEPIDRRVS